MICSSPKAALVIERKNSQSHFKMSYCSTSNTLVSFAKIKEGAPWGNSKQILQCLFWLKNLKSTHLFWSNRLASNDLTCLQKPQHFSNKSWKSRKCELNMFADFNIKLPQWQQYARHFRCLLHDVRTPEMTLTSLLFCDSFVMYSQQGDAVLTDDIHKWSTLLLQNTSPFIQHGGRIPARFCVLSRDTC